MNNKTNQVTPQKHKFNIVDIVAILIIISLVVGVFLLLNPFKTTTSEIQDSKKTILYVVELTNMDKFQSESIKKGDDIVLVSNGFDVGKILRISKVQSSKWELSENGEEMVLVTDNSKETVYITIELECTYVEDKGYFIHDYQLLVGNEIELRFPKFNEIGKCVSIEVKE